MPLTVTPDQVGQRWVQGMTNAQGKFTEGVNAVTTSPGQRAAAQADVWAMNVAAAKQKFIRNSQRVDLATWQQLTTAAAGNLASGAARKQAIFTQRITPVLAHIAGGLNRLPQRGTYEQNKQRAIAWMDYMHAYQAPAGF